MSSGLEAIANELRRLQRDGLNRVFVEDDSMQLIVPHKDVVTKNHSPDLQSGRPAQNPKLPEEGKDSHIRPVKTVTKTVTTPKVAPLPESPEIELIPSAADGAHLARWVMTEET
mgnify:CR=1 FL=1